MKLHASGTAAWDISAAVLDVIAREVRPGAATLETGAGASTLAFAAAGAEHTAVTPSAGEVARIRAAAAERGVDLSRVTFREGVSQEVLPHLSGPLDVVLIDGGHGFPIPAVDWTYTAPRLRPGGLLLVDDVDIWTGAMLVAVMDGEDAFERVAIVRGRTAVYRLTRPFVLREWRDQPTVVRRSRVRRGWRMARNGLGLLAKGELMGLIGKLAHQRDLARKRPQD